MKSIRERIVPAAFALVGLLCACSAPKPSGTVVIDGSDTVYPLSKAMADAFNAENRDVQFMIAFSGTGGGFKKFCNGQLDIEGASRPIKAAEAEQCKNHHVDYIEVAVGFDSLSVVANPKNAFLDCLTTKELKTIWEPSAENTISTWQQVRSTFPAQPLHLFGPGTESGTFDYFTLAIVGTEASSRGDYQKSEDYAVVERGVASDANALGYFPYAYYQANKADVKLVSVDSGHGCIAPSAPTVADEKYVPLTRPLFLYVSTGSAQRPEVSAYVHFFLAGENAQYVTKVGYVPLHKSALAMQVSRFDKGITGSAMGGHGSVLGVKVDWFNRDEEDRINSQLVQ